MRLSALICSMTLALNAMATTTTLRLESGDYTLEAAMTPDPQNPSIGMIETPNAQSGACVGNYTLDLAAETLTIDFDGLTGPGSVGGCNNESMKVIIFSENYKKLELGEEVKVVYMSTMFYQQPRVGRVKVVAKR